MGFLIFGFGFLEFYKTKNANLGKDFSEARCFQNRDQVFIFHSILLSFFSFLSTKSPERVIFVSLKVGFCVDLGLKRLILFPNPLLTLFLAIYPRFFLRGYFFCYSHLFFGFG